MPYQEQLNHEKFSGEKIVSLIGEALRFDRFGDPQQMEPDLIFSNGCKVGIEVTTAHYHGDHDDPNSHARDEWQFARNPTFDEHGSIGPSTRQRGVASTRAGKSDPHLDSLRRQREVYSAIPTEL